MTRKTSDQNRKFHAMAADIASQVEFAGRKWRPESFKRLLISLYVETERNEARANNLPDPFPEPAMLIEGLDGETIVQLGIQVRRLTKAQMQGLIECTYAFGNEKEVIWSEGEDFETT